MKVLRQFATTLSTYFKENNTSQLQSPIMSILVNAVYGKKNHCLTSEPYETHKYTVQENCRVTEC
jgi:hypothetical protein